MTPPSSTGPSPLCSQTIGPTGHRCNERRFVEFHHVDPHALGGEATVDKIELRCRRHNDYEGRLYFGKRRRHDTGAVREETISQRPQPFGQADWKETRPHDRGPHRVGP